VVSIATGDEVGFYRMEFAIPIERDLRPRAVKAADRNVTAFESNIAARGDPGMGEIRLNLGLTVHGDLAPHEPLEIDSMHVIIECHLESAMHQTLPTQALIHTGLRQQLNGPGLEKPGAYPRSDIFKEAALDDDGIDAASLQELRQHQTRGAPSDDGNGCLGSGGHVRQG
jgi:hypothetical protein